MADFTKFRTALSGFNRADVAEYIEAVSLTHARELKASARRIEELEAALQTTRDDLARVEGERDSLRDQIQEAETALEAATAPHAEETEEVPDYPSLELEAYRRAEAAERMALRRAQQCRRELLSFLESTTARYRDTGEDIAALSQDIQQNLTRLGETLSELDAFFTETSDRFEEMGEGIEVE